MTRRARATAFAAPASTAAGGAETVGLGVGAVDDGRDAAGPAELPLHPAKPRATARARAASAGATTKGAAVGRAPCRRGKVICSVVAAGTGVRARVVRAVVGPGVSGT